MIEPWLRELVAQAYEAAARPADQAFANRIREMGTDMNIPLSVALVALSCCYHQTRLMHADETNEKPAPKRSGLN